MEASVTPDTRIANANPQPQQERVDLWALSDLCTPWCVHVVATLRIAEHLAAGRDEINDLAAAAQCDAYCLQAVLRHLVGKGVFQEPALKLTESRTFGNGNVLLCYEPMR